MTTMSTSPTPLTSEAPPRQLSLARRGFTWSVHAGVWVRRGVALSDEAVDTMDARQWQAFLAHLDAPGCPTCGRPWMG